ncbi:hypothetical protein KIPB_014204, partial [Kipferlia bialata]|eukprot:g14204.t1
MSHGLPTFDDGAGEHSQEYSDAPSQTEAEVEGELAPLTASDTSFTCGIC